MLRTRAMSFSVTMRAQTSRRNASASSAPTRSARRREISVSESHPPPHIHPSQRKPVAKVDAAQDQGAAGLVDDCWALGPDEGVAAGRQRVPAGRQGPAGRGAARWKDIRPPGPRLSQEDSGCFAAWPSASLQGRPWILPGAGCRRQVAVQQPCADLRGAHRKAGPFDGATASGEWTCAGIVDCGYFVQIARPVTQPSLPQGVARWRGGGGC